MVTLHEIYLGLGYVVNSFNRVTPVPNDSTTTVAASDQTHIS